MKLKRYRVNLKCQVWKKDKYSDILPIRGKNPDFGKMD